MSVGISRVFALDDHPVVRRRIAGLLGIQPDMTLVGRASSRREALQQFQMHLPDMPAPGRPPGHEATGSAARSCSDSSQVRSECTRARVARDVQRQRAPGRIPSLSWVTTPSRSIDRHEPLERVGRSEFARRPSEG
jgi:hypothetical protein